MNFLDFVQPTSINPLTERDVFKKVDFVLKSKSCDFLSLHHLSVPFRPGRSHDVLPVKNHPPKLGISKAEGKARVLHNLANIELQAMELGLRTLIEFSNADLQFREELATIVQDEARHLEMCLIEIENLGFKWGDWPIHLALWDCTSPEDSLIDRILIVHRYLEGSGLDAGDTLLRRLRGLVPEMQNHKMNKIVEIISREEIGHVFFGSKYYRYFCEKEKINPSIDYPLRMEKLRCVLPRRMEPIHADLRIEAGFSRGEIEFLKTYNALKE